MTLKNRATSFVQFENLLLRHRCVSCHNCDEKGVDEIKNSVPRYIQYKLLQFNKLSLCAAVLSRMIQCATVYFFGSFDMMKNPKITGRKFVLDIFN